MLVPVPVQDPLVQLEGAGAARARRPRARGVVDGDADGDDEGERGDEQRHEGERREEAAADGHRCAVAGAVAGVGVRAAAHDDEVPPVEVVAHQARRRPRPALLQTEVAAS